MYRRRCTSAQRKRGVVAIAIDTRVANPPFSIKDTRAHVIIIIIAFPLLGFFFVKNRRKEEDGKFWKKKKHFFVQISHSKNSRDSNDAF